MRLLAPAKLNLDLRVSPRDASGFHPLRSWFVTVGLFDLLTIHRTEESGIRLACDDPRLPCDQTNLIVRAAQSLSNLVPNSPGTNILLQKRIPIGGGLGGGSSDAARTLLGLNQLWQMKLSLERLHAIAAVLGSDVPFFLHGPSSICTGRGEIVQPMAPPRAKWALLIFPGMMLSTAQVYRAFDEIRPDDADFGVTGSWTSLPTEQLLPQLRNDLEPAAFALCPQLGTLRASLEQTMQRAVRMTGSGSTLFTLFDRREQAEAAAVTVRSKFSLHTVEAELAPRIDDDLTVPWTGVGESTSSTPAH